jgi:hypothetical protein
VSRNRGVYVTESHHQQTWPCGLCHLEDVITVLLCYDHGDQDDHIKMDVCRSCADQLTKKLMEHKLRVKRDG